MQQRGLELVQLGRVRWSRRRARIPRRLVDLWRPLRHSSGKAFGSNPFMLETYGDFVRPLRGTLVPVMGCRRPDLGWPRRGHVRRNHVGLAHPDDHRGAVLRRLPPPHQRRAEFWPLNYAASEAELCSGVHVRVTVDRSLSRAFKRAARTLV